MSTPAEAWYYSTTGDLTSGPVSEARLRELFDAGSLSWHHSVRHQTWDRWYTVREAAGSLGFTTVTTNLGEVDPTVLLLPGLPSQQLAPAAGDSSLETPNRVIAPFSSDIGRVARPAAASVAPLPLPTVDSSPLPTEALPLPIVDSTPLPTEALPLPTVDSTPLPTEALPLPIADSTPLATVSPSSSAGVSVAKSVGGTASVSVVGPRQPLSADVVTPIHRVVSWAIDIAAFVVAVLLLNAVLPTDFAMLFIFVAYVLYLVVLPVRGHDTLGHVMVGLRVARRVDDGVSPWLVYGTRAAVVLLLAAPFMLGLIASACSMFGHPNAVAWQDAASGTTVVKAKAFEFSKKAALATASATPSDVAP